MRKESNMFSNILMCPADKEINCSSWSSVKRKIKCAFTQEAG